MREQPRVGAVRGGADLCVAAGKAEAAQPAGSGAFEGQQEALCQPERHREAHLGQPLQRSAHTGALTDLSYIQFMGTEGVACLDVGFPMRYSHSALEVVDPADLAALVDLLAAGIARITPDFSLRRGV